MDEPDEHADEGDSEDSSHLTQAALGSAVGSTVGVAVGGPVGAVVGAIVTPYLIQVAEMAWSELIEKRRHNVAQLFAQSSARLKLDPDELQREALSSAAGAALLSDSMQAAAWTLDERKVAALAKALANGLADDLAAVDENLMITRALADIEEPHLRLLSQLPSVGRGRQLRGRIWPWWQCCNGMAWQRTMPTPGRLKRSTSGPGRWIGRTKN